MIDSATFSVTGFDLASLFSKAAKLHTWWSREDAGWESGLSILESFSSPPYPNYDQLDPVDLLDEGYLIFVPVHEPASGDCVKCIDGDVRSSDELDIDVGDSYGVLIKKYSFTPTLKL